MTSAKKWLTLILSGLGIAGIISLGVSGNKTATATRKGKSNTSPPQAQKGFPENWPIATGWGKVSKELRRRLQNPIGKYPPPILGGGGIKAETGAKGLGVGQRIETELNGDGRPEVILEACNSTKEEGFQAYLMIFSGKTGKLQYKSYLGCGINELVVLQGDLRGKFGPYLIAIGQGGFENADTARTLEIVSWNRESHKYERLLKIGGHEAVFMRWYFTEAAYPYDYIYAWGLLLDQSKGPIDADFGDGLVSVVYAWDGSHFHLMLPKN
jgi:hypothetical protein